MQNDFRSVFGWTMMFFLLKTDESNRCGCNYTRPQIGFRSQVRFPSIPLHFPLLFLYSPPFSSFFLYSPLFSPIFLRSAFAPRSSSRSRACAVRLFSLDFPPFVLHFVAISLYLYSILSRFPSICTPSPLYLPPPPFLYNTIFPSIPIPLSSIFPLFSLHFTSLSACKS